MATTLITNQAQLNKILLQQCKKMCDKAADEVKGLIDSFLQLYYDEWQPEQYQRTYQLLNSAYRTVVKPTGNGYMVEVGIDVDSLQYEAKGADPWKTVWSADHGLHGGLHVGTDTMVFDDVMKLLDGGYLTVLFGEYLLSQGFNVTYSRGTGGKSFDAKTIASITKVL